MCEKVPDLSCWSKYGSVPYAQVKNQVPVGKVPVSPENACWSKKCVERGFGAGTKNVLACHVKNQVTVYFSRAKTGQS